jgi:hypothetical protein
MLEALAVCSCLLIGGCLFPPTITSRHVNIPRSARALEPGFDGLFWIPENEKPDAGFRTVTIHHDASRLYRFVSKDEVGKSEISSGDELGPVTILRTSHPGIDVLMAPDEKETTYMLLFRSRAGTWVIFPFIGELDTPVEGARLAYLEEIARRHGIGTVWDRERYEIRLEGKLDAASLTGLFSDPDFLGGLRLDPEHGTRFFPANLQRLPPPSDRAAWWKRALPETLTSARFPAKADELVQPATFPGEYQDGEDKLAISRLADGSYSLTKLARKEGGKEERQIVRLLPTGASDLFLGLVEAESYFSGQSEGPLAVYELRLFDLTKAGEVQVLPIYISSHDFSPTIDQFAGQVRAKAAIRHGIHIAGGHLTDGLNPASVAQLFEDRQFQSGLYLGSPTDYGAHYLTRDIKSGK